MAITVECTGCGKQLRVKDELQGKRIKCPGCGQTFLATAGAAVAPPPAALGASRTPVVKKTDNSGGGLHMETKWIVLAVIAVSIFTVTTLFYMFPMATQKEWEAQETKANDEVTEVVKFIFKADATQESWEGGLHVPTVHDVTFMYGPMHWTMPEKIGWIGVTGEGAASGFYYPATHEVTADIEQGGTVLPTGFLMAHGKGMLHGSGRVAKDGKVTGEIDGKKVTVKEPTPEELKEYNERHRR